MKVTALIPDELIEEVKVLARGKNITEALIIALSDWVATKKITTLNEQIKKMPLLFTPHFTAGAVRKRNRKR